MNKNKAVILAYAFLKKAGHRIEMDLGAEETDGSLALGHCLLPECGEYFYINVTSVERHFIFVKRGPGSDPIVCFIDDSDNLHHTAHFDSKYLCSRMKTMR